MLSLVPLHCHSPSVKKKGLKCSTLQYKHAELNIPIHAMLPLKPLRTWGLNRHPTPAAKDVSLATIPGRNATPFLWLRVQLWWIIPAGLQCSLSSIKMKEARAFTCRTSLMPPDYQFQLSKKKICFFYYYYFHPPISGRIEEDLLPKTCQTHWRG